MAALSAYLQAKVLNWIKANTFVAAPGSVYMGLFSNDPTYNGTGTEVTTTIRVAGRVAATFGSIVTTGGSSSISNSGAVDFGSSAGNATVTHFGLFDAASSGNLIVYGALTSAKALAAGDGAKFNIGDLTLTIS